MELEEIRRKREKKRKAFLKGKKASFKSGACCKLTVAMGSGLGRGWCVSYHFVPLCKVSGWSSRAVAGWGMSRQVPSICPGTVQSLPLGQNQVLSLTHPSSTEPDLLSFRLEEAYSCRTWASTYPLTHKSDHATPLLSLFHWLFWSSGYSPKALL